MKRSTFQKEYTSEIKTKKERKKERNEFVLSGHSLSNLEVICLISQTITLENPESIFEENEGKILFSSCQS